jgi:hypothetical protein
MISEANPLRRSIEQVREWIRHELSLRQKGELDRKIDQMLKAPKLKTMVRHLFVGAGLGGKLGMRGLGASIRGLRRLLAV